MRGWQCKARKTPVCSCTKLAVNCLESSTGTFQVLGITRWSVLTIQVTPSCIPVPIFTYFIQVIHGTHARILYNGKVLDLVWIWAKQKEIGVELRSYIYQTLSKNHIDPERLTLPKNKNCTDDY